MCRFSQLSWERVSSVGKKKEKQGKKALGRRGKNGSREKQTGKGHRIVPHSHPSLSLSRVPRRRVFGKRPEAANAGKRVATLDWSVLTDAAKPDQKVPRVQDLGACIPPCGMVWMRMGRFFGALSIIGLVSKVKVHSNLEAAALLLPAEAFLPCDPFSAFSHVQRSMTPTPAAPPSFPF